MEVRLLNVTIGNNTTTLGKTLGLIQDGDVFIITLWNNSEEETLISFKGHDLRYSELFPDGLSDEVLITIIVIYIFILTIGFMGNLLTCVVFIFSSQKEDSVERSKTSSIKWYLLSLGMSDILMLFSYIPYDVLIAFQSPFNYGDVGCFIRSLVSKTSSFVSILTIVAFTIERYLSVCHPFIAKRILKVSRSIKAIITTWIIGFTCGFLISWQGKNEAWADERVCKFHYTIPYSLDLIFLVIFFVPLLIMLVLYALILKKVLKSGKMQKNRGHGRGEKAVDSEKRIVIMLVVVLVAFIICTAPEYILMELQLYVKINDEIFKILFYTSGILSYLSAAINPIIYNIMSSSFRNDFKKAFLCKNTPAPTRNRRIKIAETTLNISVLNNGRLETAI